MKTWEYKAVYYIMDGSGKFVDEEGHQNELGEPKGQHESDIAEICRTNGKEGWESAGITYPVFFHDLGPCLAIVFQRSSDYYH